MTSTILNLLLSHDTNNDKLRHNNLALYNIEKEAFLQRKIKKCIGQEYELEMLGSMFKKIKSLEYTNGKLLKEKTAEANNNSWLWITINPKSELTFEFFKKKIEKIVKYSCFSSAIYCYEQRGTVEEKNVGKGFHAHILVKRKLTFKPSYCERKVRDGCKTLVGNIKNNNQIFIAKIGSEYAADKYKYMTDTKKSEKQDKQKGDISFRKKHKLSSIYKINISSDIINGWKKQTDNVKEDGKGSEGDC